MKPGQRKSFSKAALTRLENLRRKMAQGLPLTKLDKTVLRNLEKNEARHRALVSQ